ncbi:MAG: ATP-binding cassette domain-containing protein [Gammaproteobacteria bacterium]|nr:ATP-binding cassette domain-containing protein [Gammaproteobacteria bacterium]
MQAATDNSQPLVKVDNLSRRYGDTLAVNQVSFQLNKGEVLGFLGPNGAGKSTTMHIITGNLAPTGGQISINGFDIIDEPLQAKACIGYLPENPPVYRELTVDEYLNYCAKLHRLSGSALTQAVDEAKLHCGLQDVGRRLIGNLSKGFQQRVGIAQAVIHNPQVVILDEPTVGLDPIQIREIRSLIKSLGEERSVILSTHILPEVQATCDRVQIIRRGELIYHAGIDELNQRGQGQSLTLALNSPPSLETLHQLSGIREVTSLDPHRFHLQLEPAVAMDKLAEQLVIQAVEQQWGLFELIPDNTTLEEIFVELTTADGDSDDAEEADAA